MRFTLRENVWISKTHKLISCQTIWEDNKTSWNIKLIIFSMGLLNSKHWKRKAREKLKCSYRCSNNCYSCNNYTQSGGFGDLLIVHPDSCLSEQLQHSAYMQPISIRPLTPKIPSGRFNRFAGTSSHSPVVGLIVILIQLSGFGICWASGIWIRK